MNSTITLPWREFKAFVQIYDSRCEAGMSLPRELLAMSDKRAGAITREILIDHGLIQVVASAGESFQMKYLRGVPLGRDYDLIPDSIIVAPRSTSSPGAAWVSSRGRCSYCGEELRFFKALALGRNPLQTVDGTIMLSTFACKSCHAIKGSRTLEDFRFVMRMKLFSQKTGVDFSRRQVEFLGQIGVALDIPRYEFFFEQSGTGVNRWAEKWDPFRQATGDYGADVQCAS